MQVWFVGRLKQSLAARVSSALQCVLTLITSLPALWPNKAYSQAFSLGFKAEYKVKYFLISHSYKNYSVFPFYLPRHEVQASRFRSLHWRNFLFTSSQSQYHIPASLSWLQKALTIITELRLICLTLICRIERFTQAFQKLVETILLFLVSISALTTSVPKAIHKMKRNFTFYNPVVSSTESKINLNGCILCQHNS